MAPIGLKNNEFVVLFLPIEIPLHHSPTNQDNLTHPELSDQRSVIFVIHFGTNVSNFSELERAEVALVHIKTHFFIWGRILFF